MVLTDDIIEDIKIRSGLLIDQIKDYDILSSKIFEKTGRNISVTTLKRLFGQIDDNRNTNLYTLNTIGIYLGYSSWEEYTDMKNIHSEWGFKDDSIYISDLDLMSKIRIYYLDRIVEFSVILYEGEKVLRVDSALNSSLRPNDILYIYCIKKGNILEAHKLIRNTCIGNYKTHGTISKVEVY